MYLYEIPRESIIRWLLVDNEPKDILFHNIDWAYSYCTIVGTDEVVHLPATLWLESTDEPLVFRPVDTGMF